MSSLTKRFTPAGALPRDQATSDAYAADVQAANREVAAVSGLSFSVPDRIEIQTRHHWIDANIGTFTRLIELLEETVPQQATPLARTINTGSMSVTLGFLARNVLGQYDPLLLADAPPEEHALYFVHPNITAAADDLDIAVDTFRRWIAFHEVTHAAEFAAAPWLTDHLQTQLRDTLADLSSGTLAADFDGVTDRPRSKLESRRQGGGPVTRLLRQLLGIGVKRQQYERGQAFFEAVVEQRDFDTAALVWESPEHLPTADELEHPAAWLARVAD